MIDLQKAADIERKMLDAYSVCTRFAGWDKKGPQLVTLLKKRAKRDGKPLMESLIDLCQLCEDEPVTIMWLMAAGVEAIRCSCLATEGNKGEGNAD